MSKFEYIYQWSPIARNFVQSVVQEKFLPQLAARLGVKLKNKTWACFFESAGDVKVTEFVSALDFLEIGLDEGDEKFVEQVKIPSQFSRVAQCSQEFPLFEWLYKSTTEENRDMALFSLVLTTDTARDQLMRALRVDYDVAIGADLKVAKAALYKWASQGATVNNLVYIVNCKIGLSAKLYDAFPDLCAIVPHKLTTTLEPVRRMLNAAPTGDMLVDEPSITHVPRSGVVSSFAAASSTTPVRSVSLLAQVVMQQKKKQEDIDLKEFFTSTDKATRLSSQTVLFQFEEMPDANKLAKFLAKLNIQIDPAQLRQAIPRPTDADAIALLIEGLLDAPFFGEMKVSKFADSIKGFNAKVDATLAEWNSRRVALIEGDQKKSASSTNQNNVLFDFLQKAFEASVPQLATENIDDIVIKLNEAKVFTVSTLAATVSNERYLSKVNYDFSPGELIAIDAALKTYVPPAPAK